MTFDPFGDYATRGYLRNTKGADEIAVKRLEHAAFRGQLDAALEYLKSKSTLTYEDVLQTHAKLFGSVYPWAGQDRMVTAPDSAIGKGGNFTLFSHPADSRRAVDLALEMASNPATMREKPGEVMGLLAYAHPFLDGNGRTILTVHTELCRRANMTIDWSKTNKTDYLAALTKELEAPGRGYLDNYLKPFTTVAGTRVEDAKKQTSAQTIRDLPGLGPDQPQPGAVLIERRDLDAATTPAEITNAIETNPAFADAVRTLERMAGIVYKDPAAVIADVRNAAMSEDQSGRTVVKRIELDPESYGPYKGAGGIFSSQQERKDYRNAIASRTGLRGVAEKVVGLAHGIRQSVINEKRELAERAKVEIRMPDDKLVSAIEKKQPLTEAQADQIDKAVRSFEHRFGDDVGKVRTARNLEPLAQKHGIDLQQLAAAKQVLKTLDKGRSQAREQAQVVKQVEQMARGGPTR